MNKSLLIIGCLLQLLISATSVGQKNNYYQKKFTIQDGLPNNDVKWITQDKSGFLWIGTWDGLVRYDGSEFKTYRHDPNDSTSLGYFEVPMICIDADDQLWTYSGSRLCRYERAHDHFVTYDKYDFPESGPLDSSPGFDTFLDQAGQLYVRIRSDLYRYNQNEDNFQEIHYKDPGIDLAQIYDITFDNLGSMWMFQDMNGDGYGRAYQFTINKNDSLSLTQSYPVDQTLFKQYLQNITLHLKVYRNSTGNTWIASYSGLYKLSEDTIREFHGKIPPGEFSGNNIVLWSQPGKGLMMYYPEDGEQDTIFKQNEVENVVTYFADKQNNIWFTNYNSSSKKSGLELTYRTGNYFKQYLNETCESIPTAVFGLLKDKSGNIWAGGRPNDHLIKISPKGKISEIKIPVDPLTYYNYPRDMALDPEGNIWIAFYNDYLYKLNPKNNEFTDYSGRGILRQVSNRNARFRLVKLLTDGRLIAGGNGMFYILDRENFSGTFIENPRLTDSYSIYEDPSGFIWLGLNGQMAKWDLNLSKQQLLNIENNSCNIEDICAGDSTDIWLALLGGGIGHYLPDKGTTAFFTTFNGLAHNTVYSIRKDRSGNLWASHDLGISMLNPRTKSIINFDDKDGLRIREFDSEAAFQTEDGEILFGGIGGIVSFFPDSVKRRREESGSPLLISSFRVSGRLLGIDRPAYGPASVKLQKGTDDFQLELIKPDLRNGDEINYRYKLSGSNEDWITADSRHRRANYTNLSPGKHEFFAEATDLNGEWTYKTSLVIEIPFLFYQTLFFRILCVMIILGILMLFFIMKIKQIRLNEKKKQEQLKMETLRGQMNPHFIYNSLNSINYFISSNDRMNANQYITDFSRLIRSVMTNSSQDFIPLESEIQTIRDYLALEHLRFGDKFDFEIIIDEKVDQIITEIVPSLIQPFIENAIWHGMRYLEGRKGFLSVRFVLEDESFLIIYIEDDGIGRKLSSELKTGEQKKRQSRGMAMVEERLAFINSFQKTKFSVQVTDLYDDRAETGTKVRIEVPCRKFHK